MSINQAPRDAMMRQGDARNKTMSDEKTETTLSEGRVNVTVIKPFKYNGVFVEAGQVIEMNEARAVNHMRVGDLERDEELIERIKAQRIAAADAARADAEGEW